MSADYPTQLLSPLTCTLYHSIIAVKRYCHKVGSITAQSINSREKWLSFAKVERVSEVSWRSRSIGINA